MKIWDKSVLYNILHAYANWGTRWSFRRFKVEGRENVPTEGPVILACNHCNTLMDAMVVLRDNRNLTAFGARADIFRNKKIAKVLTFLRIVPLARQRDSIREMKENLHTFDEIVECIGRGVNFTIYVEGTHRAERGMMPVKRGIFRICDIAREKLGEEVTIVPVGLAYEEFFEYMKDITVRYGKPFKLSELPEGPKAEQLQQKILELICDYPVNRRDPLWIRIPLSLLSLPLFAAAGLLFTVSEQQIVPQMQLTSHLCERLLADQLRTDSGQLPLVLFREGFVKIICRNKAENRIAQKFQTLIAAQGILEALIGIGRMGKRHGQQFPIAVSIAQRRFKLFQHYPSELRQQQL